MSSDDHKAREEIALRLRRVREQVRDRALLQPEAVAAPAAPRGEAPPARPAPPEPEPEAAVPPVRPDVAAVNALWPAAPGAAPGGLKGVLVRLLRRLLGPGVEAQVAFNAKQVQFDNEVLDYIDARLAHTHDHYDRVLGAYGKHLAEADERHLIVQEELVAHVHDLVKRIDLVLSESERGRLGLEFALRDLRERVARLEAALRRG